MVFSATVIYLTMVICSRLFGPRQFSRSTGYDLAFVFGLGSLIGRVVLVRTSLLAGILGLATLFMLHALVELAHHRSDRVHRLIQNSPVLLVAHGEVLHEHLRMAHVAIMELHQQLRQSGYGSLSDVGVVILERNGRFSILARDAVPDPALLDGGIGAEAVGDGS